MSKADFPALEREILEFWEREKCFLKLVEKSPAEGNYVLVDARPGPKYHEGHIKHAVSMPLPAFDKMKDSVLPAEKDKVIVFYCGGVT